jgi:solute:Na+ symporter, SSS family
MHAYFKTLDWIVLAGYFCSIIGLGLYFHRQSKSTEGFTAGGRSLPGWLCGMSIFATYLSSISYLALPGKSFVDNWNPFVFSLAIPPATWIAIVWFLPYYRRTSEVSAYAMLEKRFGTWARVYASSFYLLFQIARMGVVMYLMALPMAVIFGWDIRSIIVVTGVTVTAYAFIGGIVAVIWADAIQAIVLLAGAIIALFVIVGGVPGGFGGVVEIAKADHKFSLGSTTLFDVSSPTIWVMIAYGLMENLKNFGIDQSYIQRYIASSSDREARRSLWIGGVLYVPVSALFFFIGTALYAYHQSHAEDLPEVRRIVASQRLLQQGDSASNLSAEEFEARVESIAEGLELKEIGDRVFPHFIAAHLAPGITAAMSTVSTSLNSSATLVMSDFYRRFHAPNAADRQLMRVLYAATVVWGVMGTGMALALVRLTDSALDIWWSLSSVLGAGILGLFLLGIAVPKAGNRTAVCSVTMAGFVILWMVVSKSDVWPKSLEDFRSPFHAFMVIVVGSLATVLVGLILTQLKNTRTIQRNSEKAK